jgi:hypothetical protein
MMRRAHVLGERHIIGVLAAVNPQIAKFVNENAQMKRASCRMAEP